MCGVTLFISPLPSSSPSFLLLFLSLLFVFALVLVFLGLVFILVLILLPVHSYYYHIKKPGRCLRVAYECAVNWRLIGMGREIHASLGILQV